MVNELQAKIKDLENNLELEKAAHAETKGRFLELYEISQAYVVPTSEVAPDNSIMLIELNTLKSDLAREKFQHRKTVQDYESDAETKMQQFQLKLKEIYDTFTSVLQSTKTEFDNKL